MPAVSITTIATEVVSAATVALTEAATAATAATAAVATATATATTTAAAVTTATATAATRPASAAAATWASLFSDVHANSATIEALSVHLLHRRLGGVGLCERHEAKAPRASRLSVGDHLGFNDLTKRGECIPKASIVRVPAEATDKQLVRHRLVLSLSLMTPSVRRMIPRATAPNVNMPATGSLARSRGRSRSRRRTAPGHADPPTCAFDKVKGRALGGGLREAAESGPATDYRVSKERMARSNYSAGKRQREKERAKKKKEKMERARERSRSGGGGVPVATVDEIQGGMMTIDQVMKNIEGGGDGEGQEQRATIPSRLFIGGLDWRVTDDELRKKLEEYGLVTDVHIVKDRDTGDSRGFGFVTMANRKDADKAIKQLDGQEFSGRNLVVRQATERNR